MPFLATIKVLFPARSICRPISLSGALYSGPTRQESSCRCGWSRGVHSSHDDIFAPRLAGTLGLFNICALSYSTEGKLVLKAVLT